MRCRQLSRFDARSLDTLHEVVEVVDGFRQLAFLERELDRLELLHERDV